MKTKIISSVAALALCGAVSTSYGQATTESSRRTVEESKNVVDVPKARAGVKEETNTTTTTKEGALGRKKETTSSTTRSERVPDASNNAEVRSRTTVETERKSKE